MVWNLRIPLEQIKFKAAFGEAVSGNFERRGVGADGAPDHRSARLEGLHWRDNRMFVEGVLWNSVFRRSSRWSIKGVWWRIFEAMPMIRTSNI